MGWDGIGWDKFLTVGSTSSRLTSRVLGGGGDDCLR